MRSVSRSVSRSFFGAALFAAAVGCKPDLGAPISVVSGPQILAVRGQPAEAAPGTMVKYDLLAVDSTGTVADPTVDWAQCHIPKSPADPNAVSAACLAIPDDAGPAPTFTAAMPQGTIPGPDGGTINIDACQHFGPDAPSDMPGVRPRDPDVTGGYYQPVRANWHADPATLTGFDLERIRCDLANAPADITAMYNAGYQLNTNPSVASITLDPDASPVVLFASGMPAPVPAVTASAGQAVTLRVAWPAASAESYLVWDLAAQTLETHREALSVSWFTSAGRYANDSTGRDEQDTTTSTDDVWTAPTTAGPVHFWVVLRDSRGGVDFAEASVDVTP
ncbi:MAG TPA: hypothetical protein VLA14_08545 [Polyangia bacterium]|nr:hypothetical protein [Polyangia bacterium]